MKKTLLVAEIGLSHEGSLGTALAMVKASKKANLDFVKFQYHKPDHESTIDETFRVNVFPQDLTRYDYWNRTSFNDDEWKTIIDYCKNLEIGFLCTPFSIWAARKLIKFGISDVKISSGDSNNYELLGFAKEHFTKIIVSVGMSTKKEIQELVNFMADFKGEFLIMQCTSTYPVHPKEVGLIFLQEIRNLEVKVGLSDHTGLPFVSMAAIASNVEMIEFHVVFSQEQFGPDSKSSITFEDALSVSNFRDLWVDLNNASYDKDKVTNSLGDVRKKFGRGLALNKILEEGEVVEFEDLTLKKPIGPLSWGNRFDIIGKKAKKRLLTNHHIDLSDFE
jgi:N,N'-diacetyllegionaminate synthase